MKRTAISFEPKKRFRGLFSFSLRTGMLAVTVFGAWLGLHYRGVCRQRDSVRAVLRHGGTVTYDYETSAFRRLRKSSVPAWLLNNLGRDHFHDVVIVNTVSDYAAEASARSGGRRLVLGDVAGFPRLERLYLSPENAVTDQGLQELRKWSGLRELLICNGAQITNAGMIHIAELEQLESLVIIRLGMNDDELRKIGELKKLEILHIEAGDLVTDNGVKHLEGLTRLRKLELRAPNITDDALRSLARLPRLKSLRVPSNRLTDEGLEVLGGMSQLQYLAIQQTSNRASDGTAAGLSARTAVGSNVLSDADSPAPAESRFTRGGLVHLAHLKRLDRLIVDRADVDAGWLSAILPDCTVSAK